MCIRDRGAKASNPTVDNDGNTLLDGALYFNTTSNIMRVYDLGNTTWLDLNITGTNLTNVNTVAGAIVNVNNVGDKTQLSIRPERVLIDSTKSDANKFQGKIEELIYLGDHIRARLDVCGNNEFIVKVPNEGSFSHKEGDLLNLSWNPDDVRALDI